MLEYSLLLLVATLLGGIVFGIAVCKYGNARIARVLFPYVVIDVETGGLDPAINGLLQIAAIDSLGRRFMMYVRAFDGAALNESAMRINGISMDVINAAPSELEVAYAFKEWLSSAPKGWFFVGANPSFDWGFLNALQMRTGIKLGLDYHKMDIQSMCLMAHAQGRIKLPLNPKSGQPLVKVDAMCEAFSIARITDTHDGMEDVLLEEHILLALLSL